MRSKSVKTRISLEFDRELLRKQQQALDRGIDISKVELSRRAARKIRNMDLIR